MSGQHEQEPDGPAVYAHAEPAAAAGGAGPEPGTNDEQDSED